MKAETKSLSREISFLKTAAVLKKVYFIEIFTGVVRSSFWSRKERK